MDANADALLRKLRDDHQSGAAQLALSALDGLAQWLDTGPVRAADWQRMVSALARARPSSPLGPGPGTIILPFGYHLAIILAILPSSWPSSWLIMLSSYLLG